MRHPARSYRLDDGTRADLARLMKRLRLTETGVVREAIRRLAAAETGGPRPGKKVDKKPPGGIDDGTTTV